MDRPRLRLRLCAVSIFCREGRFGDHTLFISGFLHLHGDIYVTLVLSFSSPLLTEAHYHHQKRIVLSDFHNGKVTHNGEG